MKVEKKMIKILHKGPIYEIGGCYGPIQSPYMEKVKTIIAMLKTGKKVVEVINGKDVPLNFENYDLDLATEAAHVDVPEVVAPVKKEYIKPTVTFVGTVAPVVETPVEDAPVVDEVFAPIVEESKEVETPEVVPVVEAPKVTVPDNKPKWNNNNKNTK